jgi:hypothetical protein
MAMTTVRSTYALDLETVRTLGQIARRWGVSKSEALRRAIRAAAKLPVAETGTTAIEALDKLQEALNLSPAQASAWARRVHSERRASSQRLEPRGS